ncbi:hypothetical protein T4D_6853 [Trichinella pseudospiralis]|uniref:Uncharacterized protein n=1 Tax=Trichinella pseudospiralis TaxID=6337 RepID=A0A0V1F471_TRIPS|nr:hypothetical protein T4D_6853 [Trichinella pseudospiralis]
MENYYSSANVRNISYYFINIEIHFDINRQISFKGSGRTISFDALEFGVFNATKLNTVLFTA